LRLTLPRDLFVFALVRLGAQGVKNGRTLPIFALVVLNVLAALYTLKMRGSPA